MKRIDLEKWFAHHSESFHIEPRELLDQCEAGVRDYAHRDAWIHARDIAEQSLHRFERIFGYPAGDVFVTREICHEIARELRHHEPNPFDLEGCEWIGRPVLDSVDPELQHMLRDWLAELAAREEHTAWREIVYFTDHLARTLIDKERMSNQADWDLEHTYPKVASRVIRMIMGEFDAHAAAELQEPSLRVVPATH